ncbi:MAG: hypothetical protein QNK23_05105 [Crocinitomicaceae bacterium]|nr:hypothetical protein [Crocinitomicaceae bacterium]
MRVLIFIYLTLHGVICIAQTEYSEFSLRYSYAGLGSNMGSMQPVFTVSGQSYDYTRQQNSYYVEQTANPEFVCNGVISKNTIDSIITLVRNIKDSVVSRTNPNITSGGIHFIHIQYDTIYITFKLHNETEDTAEKIVALLNKHITDDKKKLWLWKDWD